MAVEAALGVLDSRMLHKVIPEVTKKFNIPVVGEFTLYLRNLDIQQFSAPADAADLLVLDGLFHLRMQSVSASLTFDWAWDSRVGLHGSGNGELLLEGGAVDYLFEVTGDPASHTPQVQARSAEAWFDSLELKIHSSSTDWLYQAVLSLFNEQVKGLIQRGVRDALSNDVPDAVNKVLAGLPTHMDIHGLPFSTEFDYSIYTLAYVLIKGYGQVSSPDLLQQQPLLSKQQPQQLVHSPTAAAAAAGGAAMVRCPFEATPLPTSAAAIGMDPHMVTFYAHEAMAGCLLWGLYNAGTLSAVVVDGTVPGLHLTTDVLAMLIPELPKVYPHQPIRIEGQATSMPELSLSKETGTTLTASYRTKVFVDSADIGTPLMATMRGNVSVTAFVSWDSTVVTAVTAVHAVEFAAEGMNIDPTKWDGTVAWFVQNYGPLYPMQLLYTTFVKAPVASMITLTNTAAETMDGWWALSADLSLQLSSSSLLQAASSAGQRTGKPATRS